MSISTAGHHGPVSIRAYGDMTGHDFPSIRELSSITSPQVNFTILHNLSFFFTYLYVLCMYLDLLCLFVSGERYARHTKMLEDIVSWSAEHPQPSNLMLFVGDTSQDFVDVVELLKSRKNYRFFLAHP